MTLTQTIDAIFLDLGNTLRILVKDEAHQSQARRKIAELVGTDEDPLAFFEKLEARYKDYRKWAFEQLIEAPETELWTRWLTPDFPPERIAPVAGELTFQFRQANGRRVLVNSGRDVEGTQAAGYGMSIILLEPETLKKEPPRSDVKPDRIINELTELLDIFPPR